VGFLNRSLAELETWGRTTVDFFGGVTVVNASLIWSLRCAIRNKGPVRIFHLGCSRLLYCEICAGSDETRFAGLHIHLIRKSATKLVKVIVSRSLNNASVWNTRYL
jgi:hypothetical protein